MQRKSKLRTVPVMHPKFGSCWAVKEGDVCFGTYIDKTSADNKKAVLEKRKFEEFLLESTVNQKLKIDENEK